MSFLNKNFYRIWPNIINTQTSIQKAYRPKPCSLLLAVLCSLNFTVSIHAQWVRTLWDDGGADDEFTNPLNWTGLDSGIPNVLPGYAPPTGASNAIISGGYTGANAVEVSSYFAPAFDFNPLIVRGGAEMNINVGGTLDIPVTGFETGQGGGGSTGIVNQYGGIVNASYLYVTEHNSTSYNMDGGEITVVTLNADGTSGSGTGNFNFGASSLGENVSLTVLGTAEIDNANNLEFIVGSGSSLILGGDNANHIFADGLTVANGGTIGTGNQAVTANINSGTMTLTDGATIDYSINGETGASDSWVINSDLNIGVVPLTVNLLVDVVAGDVKQSAGPQVIFDWTGGTGPSPGEFGNITWNISASDSTRVSSIGSVIYGQGLGVNGLEVGQIGLSGFEAFSIPEPSTTGFLLLSGVGIAVRRWVQRKQRRGRRLVEV